MAALRAVFAAAVLTLAIPLLASWPLPLAPGARVLGLGSLDQLGHVWATWNASHGLGHLFHSPLVFAPEGLDLLVAHGGHLDLWLGGWLVRAGAAPLAAHNLVVMAYLGLAGLGGFVLGHVLTGRTGPALVAGAALGWSPWVFRFAAAGLVEEVFVGGLALALAGVVACERPGRRGPGLLAAAVVATTLASWEYGMFLAGAVAVGGIALGSRAAVGRVAVGSAAAALVLLPLVITFLRRTGEARAALAEALPHVAGRGADVAGRVHHSLGLADVLGDSERGPLLLLVPALLALAGAMAGGAPLRRAVDERPLPALAASPGARRALVAVAAVFLALAAGPVLKIGEGPVAGGAWPMPYAAVAVLLPFLDWFHWPERFGSVVLAAGAGLAALGTARLSRGAFGGLVVPLALAAVLLQAPLRSGRIDAAIPQVAPPRSAPAFACLPPGPVVEAPLPPYGTTERAGLGESRWEPVLNRLAQGYRLAQVDHGHPLVGGPDVPHTVPAAFRARVEADPLLRTLVFASSGLAPQGAPPADVQAGLRASGVVGVVLHPQDLPDAAVRRPLRAWLEAALGAPRCEGPGWVTWELRSSER